jgi:chemotaxis protein methyltransferase CheR
MSWSDPDFGAIARSVTAGCGLAFPPSRRPFAEAAFRRAIAAAGPRRVADYAARLASEPELLAALIAEVSVGETYFFRAPDQFAVLRTTVLPALVRAAAGRPLRIWSAGCSTGEEPYSLAMLLDASGLLEGSRLFATDVSPRAIPAARRGRYGPWSFRGDDLSFRERCFARTGNRWTIDARLRQIDFRVHNLLDGPPAGGGFDLIVCRNVLLYFEGEALTRAAATLVAALAPGGRLVTSPTDPPLPNQPTLEHLPTPAGTIFGRRTLRAAPPLAATPARPAGPPHPPLPARPRPALPRRVPAPPADAESQLARALTLLDAGQPHQAAVAARRALFLDRTLAVAQLTLARALRLTARRAAAQRALERSIALLDALAPEDAVRGAGGATAGRLRAVAAAELNLLARRAVS